MEVSSLPASTYTDIRCWKRIIIIALLSVSPVCHTTNPHVSAGSVVTNLLWGDQLLSDFHRKEFLFGTINVAKDLEKAEGGKLLLLFSCGDVRCPSNYRLNNYVHCRWMFPKSWMPIPNNQHKSLIWLINKCSACLLAWELCQRAAWWA